MTRVTGHVRLVPRKRGKVYYVKYRLPSGRQIQKCLGPAWTERSRPPAGYFTRKMAEDELGTILAKARAGRLPDSGPTDRTFQEACAEFLRYVEVEKNASPSTLIGYRSVNRALIEEFGAETRLDKITTARIDNYRARLLSEGELSRRTIQKSLVQLHGILKRAKRLKWIAVNSAEDVERVQVKRSGDFNVLTPAQVEAVARAAESDAYAALIRVAAYTGLRQGELRVLRWRDVDFALQTVFVRRNKPASCPEKAPKSHKVRSVPLIDPAAAALDGLSRREKFTGPDDFVFASDLGTPRDDGDVRDAFYAALDAAELGHLRTKDDPMVFHDLRHTFGTLGAQVWPIADLQAYMGHADVQTTMRYVHHVPKGNAASALSAAVQAALNVSPTVSRNAEIGAQLSATNISGNGALHLAEAA
jgi:integrase